MCLTPPEGRKKDTWQVFVLLIKRQEDPLLHRKDDEIEALFADTADTEDKYTNFIVTTT